MVLENPVDAGWAASNFIGIEHNESEPAITFEWASASEGTDTQFFVVGEPVVTRNRGVVLVDFAEALDPVMVLAGADVDPRKEATNREFRLVAPCADEIDDGVTGIVGNPAAF